MLPAMSEPFVPGVGRVLSADIAVPDHERVLAFHAAVLGTGEEPRWDEKLMNNLGMPIIGLGKRVAEYEHLPLQWMPHIQVADVAASVARAVELGGEELMHGKDDAGASQWAVLRDPAGAAFGIVRVSPGPPAPADEAERTARASAGRIAWLDLTVADATDVRDFYREVIGWGVQEFPMGKGEDTYADYCMLGEGGETVAGICHARGINTGLPPVWLLYLPVGDLKESVRQAEAHGGEIVKATRGDDGEYATVVVRDPVGGYLALAPG